jgi:hypothetical protein
MEKASKKEYCRVYSSRKRKSQERKNIAEYSSRKGKS